MPAKKLSERATFLLWLVDRHTEKDWSTGKLERFFYPSADPYYYHLNGRSEFTYVSGSGDANAFKGLERRGYIKRPRTGLAGAYIYELTEDGLQYVVDHGLRERFT